MVSTENKKYYIELIYWYPSRWISIDIQIIQKNKCISLNRKNR